MHLIDYYNYAAAAALVFIAGCRFFLRSSMPDNDKISGPDPSENRGGSAVQLFRNPVLYRVLAILFIAAGCILRLAFQARVPAGLHQDEANIGYESYILAAYGVDRDLHPWPVYPITYGSGGGSPLLIYLNVLTTRLFGSNVTVLRRTCSVFGCLTIPVFAMIMYYVYKNGREDDQADSAFCIAAGVFSIIPWHIMLSRWSLDSNTTPFWQLLAMLLLILAIRSEKTVLYCLAAIVCALCLYSYGSANVVIPLFLLLILPVCVIKKRLKPGQIFAAGAAFVIILIPLIAFYGVNYLGLPEILTPGFSVNRFTSNRLGNVFILSEPDFGKMFADNLRVLLQNLTTGYTDDSFENFLPSYATLYRFTFPLMLTGLVLCIWRTARGLRRNTASSDSVPAEAVILAMFLSAVIFSLLIRPRINRFVLLYAPMICFIVIGLQWIAARSGKLVIAAGAVLIFGGLLFSKDYFLRYNETTEEWLGFMPGYSEAVLYAKSLTDAGVMKGDIYHTRDNVNTLYLIALYALKTDPYLYQDTVVLLPDWDEFRHTKSFDNLYYFLPEDVEQGSFDPSEYPDDIFIINNYETGLFDEDAYQFILFDRYAVALPAGIDPNGAGTLPQP